jgi:hypothetical protein
MGDPLLKPPFKFFLESLHKFWDEIACKIYPDTPLNILYYPQLREVFYYDTKKPESNRYEYVPKRGVNYVYS